jgi:hypothetical protein
MAIAGQKSLHLLNSIGYPLHRFFASAIPGFLPKNRKIPDSNTFLLHVNKFGAKLRKSLFIKSFK